MYFHGDSSRAHATANSLLAGICEVLMLIDFSRVNQMMASDGCQLVHVGRRREKHNQLFSNHFQPFHHIFSLPNFFQHFEAKQWMETINMLVLKCWGIKVVKIWCHIWNRKSILLEFQTLFTSCNNGSRLI